MASDAGNGPDKLLLLSLLRRRTDRTRSEHEESSHGVARNGDRDRDLREEAHSQVPEGGDAAERVGHAAGEAVVGEVQHL